MRNLFIRETKTSLIWLWLSLVVIALDQWTKWLVVSSFRLHEIKPVLPSFNLTLAYNTGAAFSFLSDAGGWQRWVFMVVAIIISVTLVIWLYRTPRREWLSGVSFSLILGGAVGNLWDRLAYGHVIDFLDIYYNQWHWPAFNIADMAISVGAVLLIIDLFKRQRSTW